MILALSGRRVDAADAETPRFPLQNAARVAQELRQLFQDKGASSLVSSAACGADLIALSEAGSLGLRRKIVLPYDRKQFRESSVVDRPGEWGKLYDDILDDVEARGDLLVLGEAAQNDPYAATNHAILSEALALANKSDEPAAGLLVWNGASRGKEDFTESFGTEARELGLPVFEIRTL